MLMKCSTNQNSRSFTKFIKGIEVDLFTFKHLISYAFTNINNNKYLLLKQLVI